MLIKIAFSLKGVWLSALLAVQFVQYAWSPVKQSDWQEPSDADLQKIEAQDLEAAIEWQSDPYLDAADLSDFWVGYAIDQLSTSTRTFLKEFCTIQVFQEKDRVPVVVLFAQSETDFDEPNGARDIQQIAERFYSVAHVERIYVIEPERILKVVSHGKDGCDVFSPVQMPRERD
jgi:hypothetical protein